MSRVDPGIGFLLLDDRISSATLVARGATAAESAYTEAGAGPGVPVPADAASKWRPQIRQAQATNITAITNRSGFPGRDGAQVLVRLTEGETSDNLRAWQDPVLINGWTAPSDGWGAATAYTDYAAAVIEETGVIVITAMDDATSNAQTWSYDPATQTWTTLYDWDAGALDGLNAPLAMTYDRLHQRLLLWSGNDSLRGATGFVQAIAYYSDDFGVSWSRYSQTNVYGGSAGLGSASTEEMSIAQAPSGEWMMTALRIDGTQWASSDRGATWERAVVPAPTLAQRGRCVYGPAGFVVVGIDASNHLVCYQSASARGILSLAATVDSSTTYTQAVVCADADGTIYALAQGLAILGNLTMFRSLDGGLTWTEYDWGVFRSTSATRYIVPLQLLASSGSLWLYCTSVGSGDTNTIPQLIKLGGWSQVAHGVGEYFGQNLSRHGWGLAGPATNAWAVSYVPIATPDNLGWTALGATGTASLVAVEPALRLSTTAGQTVDYVGTGGAGPADFACMDVDVRTNTTGNVTLATMGAAGGGLYVSLVLSGVGYYYEARVDICSNGIQLRETMTPAILATHPQSMHGQFHRIRLYLTKGTASAWISSDDGVTWTRWADAVVVPNFAAAAANDFALFGIDATQVGDAYFRLVAAAGQGDWNYGVDGMASLGSRARDGVRGHLLSHSVPGAGYAYPLPFVAAQIPLLTATGGPTHLGESVSLPCGFTHPVTALSPTDSPQPTIGWRSTDPAAVRFVYDMGVGQSAWWGGGIGLVVVRAWPRQWAVSRSDDGVTWTTLGTLDLAVGAGLSWTRSGAVLVPSGAPTIARYFQRDELVGGYVVDGAFSREIVSNSPGYWSSSSSVQGIRITLDGVLGGDAASGTALELIAPTGVLCCYPASDIATRYLRITIAGGQTTPDGNFRAGVAGLGEIVGVGADPSWGWSSTHQGSRRMSRLSNGAPAVRRTGPSRRMVTYSWPDGVVLSKMRLLAQPPDIVGISGGSPIGTMEDAWSSLPQILMSRLQSATLPLVLLPRLPTTDGVTITQPELLVYGLAGSDNFGVTGQFGTEGSSEILQLGSLSVEELVP